MRRTWALAALVVMVLTCASAAAAGPRTLRVGRLTLHRCVVVGAFGWCGTVMRPLGPALANGPRIPIRFTWISADQKPAGTIVAVSGGPGGATIAASDEDISTFLDAVFDHNLLLIDNRGTGTSGASWCPAFQRTGYNTNGNVPRPTAALARIVGRCGAALNRRLKAPGGGYVHASDLYSTAYAVRDMAAILTGLRTGPVTLYGDSYGSAFVQSFVAWHPKLVKAAVLDSTYPVRDPDPWWTPTAAAARQALTRVCERSVGCDTRGGGTLARFSTLVAQVRRHPRRAAWVDSADGRRVRQTIGVAQLFELFTDAGFDPTVLRALDSSVRAAIDGDGTPFARLIATANATDNARAPTRLSATRRRLVPGGAAALFDERAPATRARQLRAAISAHPPAASRRSRSPSGCATSGWGSACAGPNRRTRCRPSRAPADRCPPRSEPGRRR